MELERLWSRSGIQLKKGGSDDNDIMTRDMIIIPRNVGVPLITLLVDFDRAADEGSSSSVSSSSVSSARQAKGSGLRNHKNDKPFR